MASYSNITSLPKIKEDKVTELWALCEECAALSKNDYVQLDAVKEALRNKGVEPDGEDDVIDFLAAVEEITEEGYIRFTDYDQKWHGHNVFAKFLEQYVDPQGIETLSFCREDDYKWGYYYIEGKMYMKQDFTVDTFPQCENARVLMHKLQYYRGCSDSKNGICYEVITKDEVRAFQEGMKIAWEMMGY